MAADWLAIKNEYVSTSISTRKLAEKYGVPYATLEKRARKEKWTACRQEHGGKVEAKARQKIASVAADREVNRLERILAASDVLLDKLVQAASELDIATQAAALRQLTGALKDIRDVAKDDSSGADKSLMKALVEVMKND